MKYYSPVVQWATMRLMLIFQCILGLQSQIIDFTNAFDQADVPSGAIIFVGITRYFKIDGGPFDIFIRSNKILYGQCEALCLWYENLWNGLLDFCYVVRKVYPFLIISNTVIFVVYVDNFLFFSPSKSDIDTVMNFSKRMDSFIIDYTQRDSQWLIS